MAATSIGPRIYVDGEAEYRQQINNIIQQSKTLDAEMDALTATFSDNATAQEKAAQSADLLATQLDVAKERTRLVREMTMKAAESTKENSTQTLKWREALAEAEKQQAILEKAVEENTKAIEGQGEVMEDEGEKISGLGDQLDGIVSKLGISLPDAAKDALNGMDGFSVGTVAAMSAAAAGIAAVYKIASSLHELTLKAAAEADDLMTRAAKTDLDVELLQELDYAQRFLDYDGIDESLQRLTVSMGKAKEGAEAQAAAFEALGVSITDEDGQMKGAWETFLEVIDALGAIGNETDRDLESNAIFGKSYDELKPLVDAGTEALQGFMATARENGYVMSHDQVEALGAVDDAVQENEAKWDSLKNKIALEWAPASIAAMEMFGSAADAAGKALIDSGLLSSFSGLITSVENLSTVSIDLFNGHIPTFLSPIEQLKSAMDGASYIIEGITFAIDGLNNALDWLTEKATNAWNAIRNFANGSAIEQTMREAGDMGYWGDYNPAFSYNAAGTDNWRGGLTWVGESGPELVQLPQSTQVYGNRESERIAAGMNTVDVDMGRTEQLLEGIYNELAGLRMRGRMA